MGENEMIEKRVFPPFLSFLSFPYFQIHFFERNLTRLVSARIYVNVYLAFELTHARRNNAESGDENMEIDSKERERKREERRNENENNIVRVFIALAVPSRPRDGGGRDDVGRAGGKEGGEGGGGGGDGYGGGGDDGRGYGSENKDNRFARRGRDNRGVRSELGQKQGNTRRGLLHTWPQIWRFRSSLFQEVRGRGEKTVRGIPQAGSEISALGGAQVGQLIVIIIYFLRSNIWKFQNYHIKIQLVFKWSRYFFFYYSFVNASR